MRIVVPHHDGSVGDEFFLPGVRCPAEQSVWDFEVPLHHDGPLSRPLPDLSTLGFGERLRTGITLQRYDDGVPCAISAYAPRAAATSCISIRTICRIRTHSTSSTTGAA